MQRREFIKSAAIAAGAPLILGGCRTFCGNSKINVAIIGCGRISTEFEVPGVLNRPDIARIVAVCDLGMKRAKLTAAVKAMQSGGQGDIRRVEVGLGTDPAGGSSAPQKIPETFDYQTWPEVPSRDVEDGEELPPATARRRFRPWA